MTKVEAKIQHIQKSLMNLKKQFGITPYMKVCKKCEFIPESARGHNKQMITCELTEEHEYMSVIRYMVECSVSNLTIVEVKELIDHFDKEAQNGEIGA